MDPDNTVLTILGDLLIQMRVSRRALEDVQRSTARYGGFEFARAFSEGAKFGQPPMFDGALLVHVVNINDLAPGNSFGGFLESIFGGIGNFFGNLIGGVVGGTLTGLALPSMIERLDRIVIKVGEIIDRLGLGKGDRIPPPDKKSSPEAQAATGESLLATLEGVRKFVKDVTALLQAGSSGPGDSSGAEAAGRTSQTPITQTGERWMAILNGVNIFLDRTSRLVDGLIVLIPMAVGAISFLIANLGAIRRALLETLQFVLRNALILRGVLLTVVFETVASAARLASSIVGIIGETIQSVLRAIFSVIGSLLEAAFDALGSLTNALQAIIRSLLQWLVDGVFNTLRAIGELSVFRTIDHLVRILPALLPGIYMLKTSQPLPENVMTMLQTAHQAAFPTAGTSTATGGAGGTGAITGAGTSTTPQIIGEFPKIDDILQPLNASLQDAVKATGENVQSDVKTAVDSMTTALSGVGGRFDSAVRDEANFSKRILEKHAGTIKERAKTLAGAITAPLEAESPATGLEAIATAYEQWLTGGGMKTVLGEINNHFKNSRSGEEPSGALSLMRGSYDRPRARVEIDSVEIILEPEKPGTEEEIFLYPPGDYPTRTDEDIWLAVHRHDRELEDRGIRTIDLDALG